MAKAASWPVTDAVARKLGEQTGLDVGLSPATSATPVACCQHLVGDSCETAGDKPEEGGDDVKSSWPLCPGLHTCYIGAYRGLRYREVERIP
ncbi:MAG: hypothetical protein NVS1B7_8710 [Candidatus Saccharimonadales bacterium]